MSAIVAATRFDPDALRAVSVDETWRARMARSLVYLGEVLADSHPEAPGLMDEAAARVAAGPVSPWVSCLYSKLVSEATKADRSEIGETLRDLRRSVDLEPAAEAPIDLEAADVPAPWWSHFRTLTDTDRKLPFRPAPPSAEDAAACAAEIAQAFELMERADPATARETRAVAALLILASPASGAPSDQFGACSTFFMRGAVMVNAAARRDAVRMADTLVHEASHILLFGLASDEPLTADRGETRYRSAARQDPRPIDGIFHACFVSTRVDRAMERMMASGALSPAEALEAEAQRRRNAAIARDTLDTLLRHATPTRTGQEILADLSRRWSRAEAA